jgi:hypothetical protein
MSNQKKRKRPGAGSTGAKERLASNANSQNVSSDGYKVNHPEMHGMSHVEVAARQLIDVIIAEQKHRQAGRRFLRTSEGLDRGEIVRHVAAIIHKRLTHVAPTTCEAAVWVDAERLFGWRSSESLKPEGES